MQGLVVVGLIVEHRCKMSQSHCSMTYRSRSPNQRTCRVTTLRRSIMQGLVVVGLIVEEIWNLDIKMYKSHWSRKFRSRSSVKVPAVHTLRRSTMQGLVVLVESRWKKCQSHCSTKYRSRSPGQGTCQVTKSRRSTTQGLVVVGLIVEKIWNVDVNCVEVTRALNIGQGHQVKVPAIREMFHASFDG